MGNFVDQKSLKFDFKGSNVMVSHPVSGLGPPITG